MHSHEASRRLTGSPGQVRRAVAVLAAQLWGDRSRTVVDTGWERVDAIAAAPGEEAAEVWVTWRVEPDAGGTAVVLRVDELDAGPDRTPELIALLRALAERSVAQA